MSEEKESTQEVPQKEKPLEKCSVPPAHVKDYQDCCEKYTKGEMSDLEVMGKVIDTLGRLRKSKE